MPISEYGSYVALVALQSTLLAVSNLGVDATAERFLPEFRTKYPDEKLLGFVVSALVARLVTLGGVIVVGMFAANGLSTLIGMPSIGDVLRLWVVAVACFGALSFASVLLEAMLRQKHAQACMSLYLASKLLAICALYFTSSLDLHALVMTEIFSGAFAALLALSLLARFFHRAGLLQGWQLVQQNKYRLGRFATFNYVAQLVFQFFSADVMKLLVARLLGSVAAASYGFAANLADIVQRYLPATLLQRLIRPVFISRYVRTGDFEDLNQMGRLILKLNLLLLLPAISLSVAYGGDLLGLLTKGKYADGHWLLVGALCLLVPASHQAILSMLASTLERNAMQFYAGLLSALGFPIALFLVPLWGGLGAIGAAATSALIYNFFASWYLRRSGYAYAPDWRALLVFFGLGVGLTVALVTARTLSSSGFTQGVVAIFLLVFYLILVRLLSVFRPTERAMLNALLPKPVFIF